MNSISNQMSWTSIALLLLIIISLPVALLYRNYLKLRYHVSYGLVAGAMVLAFWATNDRMRGMGPARVQDRGVEEVLIPLSCFLFYLFVVPLGVRLFRAWFFDDLHEGETLAGSEGAKVWLSGGNLVCVIGLTITGAYGFGYSLFALGLISVLAVLARPMLAAGVADLSAEKPLRHGEDGGESETERERVLRLLEEGKVDADGAADLLNALGVAETRAAVRPAMRPKQKLAMAGGILVLIGFLLPWFSFNPGEEMSRMSGVLSDQLGAQNFGMSKDQMKHLEVEWKTGTISVNGSDVGRGFGWVVLVCGIVGAGLSVMPQLVDDRSMRRNLLLGVMVVGSATLFYLFGSSLRHVSYGIVVVVIGYFCIGLGAAENLRQPVTRD